MGHPVDWLTHYLLWSCLAPAEVPHESVDTGASRASTRKQALLSRNKPCTPVDKTPSERSSRGRTHSPPRERSFPQRPTACTLEFPSDPEPLRAVCARRARSTEEGGKWTRDETGGIEELIKATELGADIVDIELRTRDLAKAIPLIKKRAKCLVSFHEIEKTPPLNELKAIVQKELEAGADICKVITTAQSFEDNLITLQLIAAFPKIRIVSFAMGPLGLTSRVLCPLVGGEFTYASIGEGLESAPGQITVRHLRRIYEMVKL